MKMHLQLRCLKHMIGLMPVSSSSQFASVFKEFKLKYEITKLTKRLFKSKENE